MAFGFVLMVALVLRIWELDGALENFDEPIAVYVSKHLETWPGWDNNWKGSAIPHFSAHDQYNFSAYLYATHIFRRSLDLLSDAAWIDARDGLIAHRLFSALCGTAAVGFVMATGRRIGGGQLALMAGLLVALSPQLVQEAHFARPEGFMTMVAMVMIWLGFLPTRAAWRPAAMAFLVGILTATKFSNAALLILPAFTAVEIWRDRTATGSQRIPELMRWGGVVALGFAGGWALGVPYALVNWEQYLTGVRLLTAQYAGSHPPFSLPDYSVVWPLMGAHFKATLGLPLLAAAALGMFFCVREGKWRTVALLVVPTLASIWLFGSQRVFFERNLCLVLPAMLLLSAMGLAGIFAALTTRPWHYRAATTAAVLLASLTGDRVLLLFLRDSMTGVDERRLEAFQEELKRDYPGVPSTFSSLFYEGDIPHLKHEAHRAGGQLLLFLWDMNDAYKARWLPVLERELQAIPVGECREVLADYPTSSMHGKLLRVYLLRTK